MKNILKALRLLFRFSEWCLIASAVLIVILIIFGIHPYAVKTGSMEPEIPTGSICFIDRRASFENVKEDDIISFKSGDMLVTHRAVRIDEYGITTKGDANNTEDMTKVTNDNYFGKTVFWVPWFGKILLFLQTKRGKVICIDVIVLLLASFFFENRLARIKSEENNDTSQCHSDKDNTL